MVIFLKEIIGSNLKVVEKDFRRIGSYEFEKTITYENINATRKEIITEVYRTKGDGWTLVSTYTEIGLNVTPQSKEIKPLPILLMPKPLLMPNNRNRDIKSRHKPSPRKPLMRRLPHILQESDLLPTVPEIETP